MWFFLVRVYLVALHDVVDVPGTNLRLAFLSLRLRGFLSVDGWLESVAAVLSLLLFLLLFA